MKGEEDENKNDSVDYVFVFEYIKEGNTKENKFFISTVDETKAPYILLS